MRFAIYSRKSVLTGRGESIENQVELCRSYLAAHYPGVRPEEVAVYEDGSSIVGLSQKELEKQAFFDLVQLFFHFTTLTKERMWNMGNLIAVTNFKGGVGKTVTAVNVAAILATEYGQRVLLIDADPQANATQSLLPPGEYDTLARLLAMPDAYYGALLYHSSIRGLDVLPADDELRNLDVDLLQGERPNLRAIRDLRDAVAEADAYDCIVIDCPPALSPACAAAIAASTDVVIPIKVDAYSVRGMNELTAQIDRLRSIYPDVHVAGCLPTMWYRSDTVEQGERLLREQAPVHVFASHIRRSPKVDESTWTGEPVVSWSPRSAAAQDYRAFVTEFLGEGVGE